MNSVVLAEFTWTLRTRFKYGRVAILSAVEAMLQSAAFVMPDREAVNAAVTRSRDDAMDFADALIGELNIQAGCRTTMTFDGLSAKRGACTDML